MHSPHRLVLTAAVVALGLVAPAAASAASCPPTDVLPTSASSPLKADGSAVAVTTPARYATMWGILSPKLAANLTKNGFTSGAIAQFANQDQSDEAHVGVEVLGSAAQAKAQMTFEMGPGRPKNETDAKQKTVTSGSAKGFTLQSPGGKFVAAQLWATVGPRVVAVNVNFDTGSDGGALAPAKSLMAATLKQVQASC